MTAPGPLALVAAGVVFVPALVWTIIAHDAWRFLRSRRPRSQVFHLLPLIAASAAVFYTIAGLVCAFPPTWHSLDGGTPPTSVQLVFVAMDWSMIVALVLARHAQHLLTAAAPPGMAWLLTNYGSAVLMGLLSVTFGAFLPAATVQQQTVVYLAILYSYAVVMMALIVRGVSRLVRSGMWWPGSAAFVASRADAVLFGGGLLGLIAFGLLMVLGGQRWEPSVMRALLSVLVSWTFAIPLAVRILREVTRGVVVAGTMLAATVAVAFSVRALHAATTPDLHLLVDLGALVGLMVVVVPGQAWLRARIDDLVSRRPRRQRAELQAFLHALSPEHGIRECCRRALAELVRVRQLRGAAIVLRTGEAVVHGDLGVESLRRLWPGAGAAPAATLISNQFLELPTALREALLDAQVVAVVPVASPRGRTGELFLTAGLLAGTFDDEDVQVLEGFADQLALVLDGAELLARTITVERSLAHAEKLAAIGELAARIAHDIRNPVTAARSLAQQLARQPASPFAAEHGVILDELERVERQVADLLRFARRDELRVEPVDLAELVRGTVAQLRPRLEAGGITVELDTAHGVSAPADRERLRQVLVNLIENAIDALGESPNGRRLALVVGTEEDRATLRVSDNGPGVDAEALPRLFEPFFSTKPHGTGLGLAIARRTIEAHGGRIEVEAGTGMTFHIELPLVASHG